MVALRILRIAVREPGGGDTARTTSVWPGRRDEHEGAQPRARRPEGKADEQHQVLNPGRMTAQSGEGRLLVAWVVAATAHRPDGVVRVDRSAAMRVNFEVEMG